MRNDPRFDKKGESEWSCAPLETFVKNRPLSETVFVTTDIETTGSIKGNDRIIDIAAIKTKNNEILDQFETLVNPEKNISRTITRLTGITQETVKHAPVSEFVLPQYAEFLNDHIFVAHNSNFDYSFINYELIRITGLGLRSPIDICTYRLAKKLLPNVKSRGVSGLIKHFDYQVEDRHRAMPDVKATLYFLDIFLKDLNRIGIKTLFELIEFQKEKITHKNMQKKLRVHQRNKTRKSQQKIA
ncbi:MAG: 3'-5' exonuclease [Deltaproteobacteria bacterium]|nr:3'-5' exonuclease [Deltaproteobacteria bacterium]